jgi:hypothetical protein
MRYNSLGLLALAGLLGWAGSAQAQVVICAPFVRVVVGRDGAGGPVVHVRAPFVNLNLGAPRPVEVVPPQRVVPPEEFLPAPTPLPPAPEAVPVVLARPMTLGEFARSFQPTAGTYEMVLLHPRTNSPVKVVFTLPEGTPHVSTGRRDIRFDYGRTRVHVVFALGGAVRVRYVH